MKIIVVRLSSRGYRDLRITTHIGLVARAFGAEKVILDNAADDKIGKTIEGVRKRFGGNFEIEYCVNPIKKIQELKKDNWKVVHLTMYGDTPQNTMKWLRKNKVEKIVIVVGADKVPKEVYELADYNTGITRQPHSEVAALGVFMHYVQEGNEEKLFFEGAKQKNIPNSEGKKVIR